MSASYQKRLLSVAEARDFIAAATGRTISARWIYELIRQGRLPAIEFDQLVIDESDIVAFLEQLPRVQPVAAAPPPTAEPQAALEPRAAAKPQAAAKAKARRTPRGWIAV